MPDPIEKPPRNIELQNLTYQVGTQTLIDIRDLSLNAVGTTVIMGPNGAGKSLLLRLLHGMITPSTGQITYGDQPLNKQIRLKQSLVFQTPVLLRRSAEANLRFVLKSRGLDPETDGILSRVGLSEKAKTSARRLSGGEKQRLALAQALAVNPTTLFLDEPTASLDPASTKAIESIVSQVRDSGLQVIFVTHDIAQARRLADHVVFLSSGRVVDRSSASDFFNNPQSLEAQAYLEGKLL